MNKSLLLVSVFVMALSGNAIAVDKPLCPGKQVRDEGVKGVSKAPLATETPADEIQAPADAAQQEVDNEHI